MSAPDDLKTQLAALVLAVVEKAATRRVELRALQGIALYDPRKDAFISEEEVFRKVEAGVGALPLVAERYGSSESRRIALQLVYEYFLQVDSVRLDAEVLGAIWGDFVAEMESPIWLTRSVANLRHFHTDIYPIDLGKVCTTRHPARRCASDASCEGNGRFESLVRPV